MRRPLSDAAWQPKQVVPPATRTVRPPTVTSKALKARGRLALSPIRSRSLASVTPVKNCRNTSSGTPDPT